MFQKETGEAIKLLLKPAILFSKFLLILSIFWDLQHSSFEYNGGTNKTYITRYNLANVYFC